MLVELGLVEQRHRAVLEVLEGAAVMEVAAGYGVSRQSVHAWLRKYASHGLAGLADRSSRPDGCPHQMPAGVEAGVVELRLGPSGVGASDDPVSSGGGGGGSVAGPVVGVSAVWCVMGWSRWPAGVVVGRITGGGSDPGPWSCGRWTW